jgi:hypothetical protein
MEGIMKRLEMVARLGVCLVVLGMSAGCGKSPTATGGTGMSQQNADDFAVQAVAALDVVAGDVEMAFTTTPPTTSSESIRPGPVRALWDTTFTKNGLSYTASRTLYDDTDAELPTWSASVARVHWTSTANGTLIGLQDTASVTHQAVLDVRGVQDGQDTLKFDGGCIDTLQNRFRSMDGTRTRYFLWASLVDIASVRFLKSTIQSDGRPIGGTVTFTVSADRLRSNDRADVEAHIDATVVIVFNDDGTADITVDATHSYRWNLQTNVIVRA